MKATYLQPTEAPGDDERFDRLVDGALSADEYRAFLSALDDEPGAWRRCALAFLEAQALAGEASQLRRSLEERSVSATPGQNFDLQSPGRRPAATKTPWSGALAALAIAVSLLAALTLGIVAPGFFVPREQDAAHAGNLTTQSASEAAVGGEGDRHQVLRPIGNVRLVMDGAEGNEALAGNVPVYDAGANVDEFLSREEAVLGADLIDLLKQYGYEVRHEQQYVPAPLDDGRQLIVPVDGYQITPVSRRY